MKKREREVPNEGSREGLAIVSGAVFIDTMLSTTVKSHGHVAGTTVGAELDFK